MFETACISDATKDNNASNGIQVILSVCDRPGMERPEVKATRIIQNGDTEIIANEHDVVPYLEQYVMSAWEQGKAIPWRRAYAIAHGTHQKALEQRYGKEGAEQFRRCVEYLAVQRPLELQTTPADTPQDKDATRIGFNKLGRRAKKETTKIGYAPARA